jgi:hypothetical protein
MYLHLKCELEYALGTLDFEFNLCKSSFMLGLTFIFFISHHDKTQGTSEIRVANQDQAHEYTHSLYRILKAQRFRKLVKMDHVSQEAGLLAH